MIRDQKSSWISDQMLVTQSQGFSTRKKKNETWCFDTCTRNTTLAIKFPLASLGLDKDLKIWYPAPLFRSRIMYKYVKNFKLIHEKPEPQETHSAPLFRSRIMYTYVKNFELIHEKPEPEETHLFITYSLKYVRIHTSKTKTRPVTHTWSWCTPRTLQKDTGQKASTSTYIHVFQWRIAWWSFQTYAIICKEDSLRATSLPRAARKKHHSSIEAWKKNRRASEWEGKKKSFFFYTSDITFIGSGFLFLVCCTSHLPLWTRLFFFLLPERLTSLRGARNIEIERYRDRSSRAHDAKKEEMKRREKRRWREGAMRERGETQESFHALPWWESLSRMREDSLRRMGRMGRGGEEGCGWKVGGWQAGRGGKGANAGRGIGRRKGREVARKSFPSAGGGNRLCDFVWERECLLKGYPHQEGKYQFKT